VRLVKGGFALVDNSRIENAPLSGKEGDAVRRELALIETQGHHIATVQFVQARIWHTTNLLLGLPTAGIAAAAGGLTLADTGSPTLAGTLALASAILGSFQTVLAASKRQATAERCGNQYLEIRNAARRLLRIDMERMTFEEARRGLEQIALRQEEINRAAEPPSWIAIRIGGRYAAKKSSLPGRNHLAGAAGGDEERG
jgi:hypothetical protein